MRDVSLERSLKYKVYFFSFIFHFSFFFFFFNGRKGKGIIFFSLIPFSFFLFFFFFLSSTSFFYRTAIISMAIHPSGKLALSVSQDRILICWNLLLGLKATKQRLPNVPVSIFFNPSGTHFAILYATQLHVFSIEQPDIPLFTFSSTTSPFQCGCFFTDHHVMLGSDTLLLLSIPSSSLHRTPLATATTMKSTTLKPREEDEVEEEEEETSHPFTVIQTQGQ
ncbi:p21-activated protein kinase-interacting protein 1-like protein, partial [Coelomomyces lativittatus]